MSASKDRTSVTAEHLSATLALMRGVALHRTASPPAATRPEIASASTSQKVQMLNEPSTPSSPPGPR